MNNKKPSIAIFGAGSTGCFLGAQLSLAGLDVSLVCRERIKQSIIDNNGITVTDYKGLNKTVMPKQMITEGDATQRFDVIFIMVKCHSLPSCIEQILSLSHDTTSLIFMQNGLGSLDLIKSHLTSRDYHLGITMFNVLQKDNAVFHQGTEGRFIFQQTPHTEQIQQHMIGAGLECQLVDSQQIDSIVYGKLLLNLNNAFNAISDMPIKQELENTKLRHTLAKAMQEWLDVAKQKDIQLAKFSVKPSILPKILHTPDWLFKLLAKKMLTIDPQARSSMWEDIQAGHKTEIEFLNGAVVKLGKQFNVPTPINQKICSAISQLEAGQKIEVDNLFQ